MYFLEQKHFSMIKNYGDFWKYYSLKKPAYDPSFKTINEMKKYPFIKHFGVNESKGNLIKLNINYQVHAQIFEFCVKIDCDIKNLGEIVKKKLGLPEKVFALFFEGKHLNSEKNFMIKLSEFNIKHESVIYILLRNRELISLVFKHESQVFELRLRNDSDIENLVEAVKQLKLPSKVSDKTSHTHTNPGCFKIREVGLLLIQIQGGICITGYI